MHIRQRRYDKEEIARRGAEIYERKLRPFAEPAQHGKYVAIDIETEEYEIADTSLEAADRLIDRLPDSQIWCLRVGYKAMRTFGHGLLENP